MVYIDSAYLGDEKSSRNVTKSLIDKIRNGESNTVVDEKLYPTVETTDEVKLTTEDQKNIRAEALKKCNPADQKCLEVEMNKVRKERIQEKEREAINSTPVIKGRRLTVNVIGDDGQRRTLVTPDGQKVDLKTLKIRGESSFTYAKVREKIWNAVGYAVEIFILIFLAGVTFVLFKQDGNMTFAWGSIGANTVIPYSGTFAAFFKYFWKGWTS